MTRHVSGLMTAVMTSLKYHASQVYWNTVDHKKTVWFAFYPTRGLLPFIAVASTVHTQSATYCTLDYKINRACIIVLEAEKYMYRK